MRKAKLIRDMPWDPRDKTATRILPEGAVEHPKASPAGTIIVDHNCHMLVRMGVAIPANDECTRAANMSDEQLTEAQRVYPRLDAGILPEHFAAWDAGIMTGYNPDGSWIPGPNAPDNMEELELADENEDNDYEDEDDE